MSCDGAGQCRLCDGHWGECAASQPRATCAVPVGRALGTVERRSASGRSPWTGVGGGHCSVPPVPPPVRWAEPTALLRCYAAVSDEHAQERRAQSTAPLQLRLIQSLLPLQDSGGPSPFRPPPSPSSSPSPCSRLSPSTVARVGCERCSPSSPLCVWVPLLCCCC